MTISKKSQFLDLDGVNLSTDELFADDVSFDVDKDFDTKPLPIEPMPTEPLPTEPMRPTPLFPTQKPDTLTQMPSHSRSDELNDLADENELMVTEGPMEQAVSAVVLPFLPGSTVPEEEDEYNSDLEVEEEEDEVVVDEDPWSWTCSTFNEWLPQILQMVPPHTGRETAGLERAISHLEAIDREISKAVRSDRNGEIDISLIEKARDEMYDGIVRLQERLEKIRENKYSKKKKKNKKSASEQHDMIKSAKSAHVGDMVIAVPFIVSVVARTCLNSMISAGKDIEDTFDKLAKEFDLTRREEAETIQLLKDMGYAMRRPRGYARDEEIDYTLTDNNDWQANYPG